MSDPVNHPKHYTSHPVTASHGVECIDVIEHLPFNVGAAVKYLWRAGLKGDRAEDLRKAAWYVQRELDRMAKEQDEKDRGEKAELQIEADEREYQRECRTIPAPRDTPEMKAAPIHHVDPVWGLADDDRGIF